MYKIDLVPPPEAPEAPRMTLTVDQMARELNISRPTAYKLANDPSFYPAVRIGKRYLINRAKLQEWLDSMGSSQKNKSGGAA